MRNTETNIGNVKQVLVETLDFQQAAEAHRERPESPCEEQGDNPSKDLVRERPPAGTLMHNHVFELPVPVPRKSRNIDA